MRSAMMRHTVPTPALASGGAGSGRGDAAARGRRRGAPRRRTSAASTAPPGPEPRTARRSTPRSAASRRAFGDAATRRDRPVAAIASAPFRLSTYASTSAFSISPARGLHAREVHAVLLGDLRGRAGTPCAGPRRPRRRRGGRRPTGAAGAAARPLGRGAGRCAGCGAGLARRDDQRDRLAHRHHVARLRGDLAQHAGGRRLDLDRDLVGLDLDDRLALAHRVAGRLEPRRTLPVSCASSSAGMMTVVGISAFRLPQSAWAASNTLFSDGTVRSSSTGENGTGTSMAPMRFDRRVQVVERALGDDRGDLGGDAVALVALVHHDGARGLLGRVDQRLLVERPRRPRVDHLRADAALLQHLGRAQGHAAPCCWWPRS